MTLPYACWHQYIYIYIYIYTYICIYVFINVFNKPFVKHIKNNEYIGAIFNVNFNAINSLIFFQGWGRTLNDSNTGILNELHVSVWDQAECRNTWGSSYVNDGHICVGTGDTGACNVCLIVLTSKLST